MVSTYIERSSSRHVVRRVGVSAFDQARLHHLARMHRRDAREHVEHTLAPGVAGVNIRSLADRTSASPATPSVGHPHRSELPLSERKHG